MVEEAAAIPGTMLSPAKAKFLEKTVTSTELPLVILRTGTKCDGDVLTLTSTPTGKIL